MSIEQLKARMKAQYESCGTFAEKAEFLSSLYMRKYNSMLSPNASRAFDSLIHDIANPMTKAGMLNVSELLGLCNEAGAYVADRSVQLMKEAEKDPKEYYGEAGAIKDSFAGVLQEIYDNVDNKLAMEWTMKKGKSVNFRFDDPKEVMQGLVADATKANIKLKKKEDRELYTILEVMGTDLKALKWNLEDYDKKLAAVDPKVLDTAKKVIVKQQEDKEKIKKGIPVVKLPEEDTVAPDLLKLLRNRQGTFDKISSIEKILNTQRAKKLITGIKAISDDERRALQDISSNTLCKKVDDIYILKASTYDSVTKAFNNLKKMDSVLVLRREDSDGYKKAMAALKKFDDLKNQLLPPGKTCDDITVEQRVEIDNVGYAATKAIKEYLKGKETPRKSPLGKKRFEYMMKALTGLDEKIGREEAERIKEVRSDLAAQKLAKQQPTQQPTHQAPQR